MSLAVTLRRALAAGHARGDLPIGRVRDPRLDPAIEMHHAAVLVAITDRPEPGLILTQRSASLRKHAGQVAFPGGRVDADDSDEIAAALREAHEEIALPPSKVEVVGTSDRFQTFTGFDIIPVIGVAPPDLPLRARAGEVEDWFEVPLAFALSPENHQRRTMTWDDRPANFVEINWQDRRIWGITAAILTNLSYRLGYDDPVA